MYYTDLFCVVIRRQMCNRLWEQVLVNILVITGRLFNLCFRWAFQSWHPSVVHELDSQFQTI